MIHDDKFALRSIEEAFNYRGNDEKTVAERKWQQGNLAPVAQKPCDHGLFSDDAKQQDLF